MVSKSLGPVEWAGLPRGRALIVIDTSYPSWIIEAFGTWEAVTCRDLEGFFDRVLTVNPLSSVVAGSATGVPDLPLVTEVSPRHTFIDGSHLSAAPVLRLPITGLLAFGVAQIRLIGQVVKWGRGENVIAVRGGDPLYAGLFAYGVSRILRVALVVRVGGNNARLRKELGHALMPRLLRSSRIEQWIERFVFRRAAAVLPANLDYQEFAVASGAPLERCMVIRYGNLIDACHFVPPSERNEGDSLIQECGVPPGSAVLLFVGRLNRLKSSMDVVALCSFLEERGIPFQCLMVGEGSDQDVIQERIEAVGLEGRVHLCGRRSQEWLSRVLPHVSVFVSPLAGRALTEAALAGAPVAAYDIDWQAELILDGETGLLAPFGDARALTDRVVELLNAPEEARRLGQALRSRALRMMDPATLNEAERAVYTGIQDGQCRHAEKR